VSNLEAQLGIESLSGAYEDKNEGVIAGEVANVQVMPNNKGIVLSIKARANNRVSLPAVALFDNISRQAKVEQVKKGDIVALSCFIHTNMDKNNIHRESLVAREFALIERK